MLFWNSTRGINKTNFAISNIKEKYLDTPSKIVITSGSLEPVIDGGGENSVFARSFVDALTNANSSLTALEVYNQIYSL